MPGKHDANRENKKKRYSKIQQQFKERMNELNGRGARPRTDDVISSLAEDWCLSTRRIEVIIKMEL